MCNLVWDRAHRLRRDRRCVAGMPDGQREGMDSCGHRRVVLQSHFEIQDVIAHLGDVIRLASNHPVVHERISSWSYDIGEAKWNCLDDRVQAVSADVVYASGSCHVVCGRSVGLIERHCVQKGCYGVVSRRDREAQDGVEARVQDVDRKRDLNLRHRWVADKTDFKSCCVSIAERN